MKGTSETKPPADGRRGILARCAGTAEYAANLLEPRDGASRAAAWMRAGVPYLFLLITVLTAARHIMVGIFTPWFDMDDFLILEAASERTLPEFLLTADGLRSMNLFYLTPLLGASPRIDWVISGLSPTTYIIHTIVSLTLVGWGGYALLRAGNARRLPAMLAAGALQLAPATLSVAAAIATRHYLEGLGFSLFALACVTGRTVGRGRILGAVALFGAALLCKEIWVVVPVVALLVSEPGVRERARRAGPLFAVLAAYMLLRTALVWGVRSGFEAKALDVVGNVRILREVWTYAASRIFWFRPGTNVALPALCITHLMAAGLLVFAWRRGRTPGASITLGLLGVAALPMCVPFLRTPFVVAEHLPVFHGVRFMFLFSCLLFGGLGFASTGRAAIRLDSR